jgi:hypothetical protein
LLHALSAEKRRRYYLPVEAGRLLVDHVALQYDLQVDVQFGSRLSKTVNALATKPQLSTFIAKNDSEPTGYCAGSDVSVACKNGADFSIVDSNPPRLTQQQSVALATLLLHVGRQTKEERVIT